MIRPLNICVFVQHYHYLGNKSMNILARYHPVQTILSASFIIARLSLKCCGVQWLTAWNILRSELLYIPDFSLLDAMSKFTSTAPSQHLDGSQRLSLPSNFEFGIGLILGILPGALYSYNSRWFFSAHHHTWTRGNRQCPAVSKQATFSKDSSPGLSWRRLMHTLFHFYSFLLQIQNEFEINGLGECLAISINSYS